MRSRSKETAMNRNSLWSSAKWKLGLLGKERNREAAASGPPSGCWTRRPTGRILLGNPFPDFFLSHPRAGRRTPDRARRRASGSGFPRRIIGPISILQNSTSSMVHAAATRRGPVGRASKSSLAAGVGIEDTGRRSVRFGVSTPLPRQWPSAGGRPIPGQYAQYHLRQ